MKKLIFIALIAGIMIAAIVFLYVFRKSDTGGIKRKPDYTLIADSLVSLYAANEDSANACFLDKIIQVTGTVAEIAKDSAGATIILRNPDAFEGVSCCFGSDQSEKTAHITEGAVIVVKGICVGRLIDVSLNRCSFVDK